MKCPCCGGTGEVPEPATDDQRRRYASLAEAIAALGPRSFPTLTEAFEARQAKRDD